MAVADERQTEPVWSPIGRADVVGEWDGVAWTGRSRVDPVEGAVPHRRVVPFGFVAHLWFWLLIGGVVITAGAGFLGDGASTAWWMILAAVGMIAILSSVVVFFDKTMRFRELRNWKLLLVLGLASGAVANLLAYLIEPILEPALGTPFAVDLWLSGPVEETAKLALPVVLLVTVRRVAGDPRAGVLVVLLSGCAFGVWEGFDYIVTATGQNGTVLAGLSRGIGEIPHPLWTAIAASLIWLAAHRSGRVLTLPGLVGWVIAMLLHSLHDGLGALNQTGTQNTISSRGMATVDAAVVAATAVNAFTLVVIAVSVLILRHVARELVPPTAIAANPPRWRPRLKQWGLPRHGRVANPPTRHGVSRP